MSSVQAVEDVVASFKPGQEQAIFDLITDEGITHIYLGEKGGALGPAISAGRPGFDTVYQAGGVTIIAVAGP